MGSALSGEAPVCVIRTREPVYDCAVSARLVRGRKDADVNRLAANPAPPVRRKKSRRVINESGRGGTNSFIGYVGLLLRCTKGGEVDWRTVNGRSKWMTRPEVSGSA